MRKIEKKPKLLSRLRAEINKVDSEIIDLIAKRREISLEVIKVKNKVQAPIREKKREAEVLNRIISKAKIKKLDPLFVSRIFQEIIHDSVRLQQKYVSAPAAKAVYTGIIKIALQGIEGSYSHSAAKKYFGNSGSELILFSKRGFAEAVESVETGEADYVVLPIENSTTGGIHEVYDLLMNTTLSITGEEIYKVNHCLASIKKTPLKKIKKIYTHYQGAAQCSKFLETLPDCTLEFLPDTAMSFRKIKEERNPSFAAIASEEAAKMYGLKVIKANIANQAMNFTRFLILSREPAAVDKKAVRKTSLAIFPLCKEGTLAEVITALQKKNISITKLEPRPVAGKPWEEMFYLDFIGNAADKEIKKLLNKLMLNTKCLKVLGCYPVCSNK